MSRVFKKCVVSCVLATFAPLILFSMWTKKKVGYRLHDAFALTGFHLSRHRDLWLREITLYEIVSGEIPRKSRK